MKRYSWKPVGFGAAAWALLSVALAAGAAETVELPLLSGWFQGRPLRYISTDMSDPVMAQKAGVNLAPRLRHALREPVPGQPSAVDRVYKFANFDQGSVFPSAPQPAGPASASPEYTPLWAVYMVTWLPHTKPRLLRSEQEVLDAEDKQQVSVQATGVVVNCPILFFPEDGLPVGIKLHGDRP